METKDARKDIPLHERLIVAFDFNPKDIPKGSRRRWVHIQAVKLAEEIARTGVCCKYNTGLRALGYDLIDEMHDLGLLFCADLKGVDIGVTLEIDGLLLEEASPELLTVYGANHFSAIAALRAVLPDTEILGVTVLTNMDEAGCDEVFHAPIADTVESLSNVCKKGGVDGFVCSPHEARILRKLHGYGMTINTPAIRPNWSIVPGDDQNPDRIMTPLKAFQAGVDRVIIGRPITQAKSPYDAVMRTLDEMAEALL